MKKKILLASLVIVLVQLISSCGSTNRCGGKRDCNGVKKTYNKSGGFWM